MPEPFFALDGQILLWLQEHLRVPALSAVLCPYTLLGDAGFLWIALSLVMLCFKKTRKAGVLSLCAMVLGLVCTNIILKPLISRPRPWLTVEGLVHIVAEDDPNSFPSGHTCSAFAAAGAWWYTLPKRWMGAAALVLAALMGFSRLYVGVHFPTDVLAGTCVGLLCAWMAWRLYRKFHDRLPRALQ